MEQDPEVPDKLWATILIKVIHIEQLCNDMNEHNFNHLRQTVGMMGCLQHKFEA